MLSSGRANPRELTIILMIMLMTIQIRKRLAGRDAAVEAQMVMEDLLPRWNLIMIMMIFMIIMIIMMILMIINIIMTMMIFMIIIYDDFDDFHDFHDHGDFEDYFGLFWSF